MSATEPVDGHDESDEHGSWDAFWDEQLRRELAERGQEPTTTIRGVNVRIPADLPLGFEVKLERADEAGDEATFKQLLADLFGVDVFDAWVQKRMGGREFKVVLAWAINNGRGNKTSFREAYELVRAAAGKAPAATQETTNSTRTSDESADSGR